MNTHLCSQIDSVSLFELDNWTAAQHFTACPLCMKSDYSVSRRERTYWPSSIITPVCVWHHWQMHCGLDTCWRHLISEEEDGGGEGGSMVTSGVLYLQISSVYSCKQPCSIRSMVVYLSLSSQNTLQLHCMSSDPNKHVKRQVKQSDWGSVFCEINAAAFSPFSQWSLALKRAWVDINASSEMSDSKIKWWKCKMIRLLLILFILFFWWQK